MNKWHNTAELVEAVVGTVHKTSRYFAGRLTFIPPFATLMTKSLPRTSGYATTALAQLRTGKHRALQAYENMIDGEVSQTCPHCKEEDHILEHWLLRCPATLRAKQEIFGDEEIGLHFLTKYPARSLALARRTLDINRQ